jgi:Arc/MetJ family transcription regulator
MAGRIMSFSSFVRGRVRHGIAAGYQVNGLHLQCVYRIRMKRVRKASAERTNIVLDSKLIQRVKRLAKVKTTRDAVHVALEHYVRSRDYSGVLALRGTGGVSEGYDPKGSSPPR